MAHKTFRTNNGRSLRKRQQSCEQSSRPVRIAAAITRGSTHELAPRPSGTLNDDPSPERLASGTAWPVYRIGSIRAPSGALENAELGRLSEVIASDEELQNRPAESHPRASRAGWSWVEILLLAASLGAVGIACFLAFFR